MSGTEITLECGYPDCNETFNTGRSLWAAAAAEGPADTPEGSHHD